MNNLFKTILIFGVILLLSGCGISERWKTEARVLKRELNNIEKRALIEAKKYKEYKSSSEYTDFKKYAKKENWAKNFKDTSALIKTSKELEVEIFKIIENDDEDEQEKLKKLNQSMKKNIDDIKVLYSYVSKRIAFIRDTKTNISTLITRAQGHIEKADKRFGNTQTRLKKATKDYPKKEKEISIKETKLKEVYLLSKKEFSILEKELQITSAKRDYALIGDSYKNLVSKGKQLKEVATATQKKISELYKSYSTILTDLKIDNLVQVTRSTWNEYAEYGRDNIFMYEQSKVSSEVYDYFYKLEVDNIAGYNTNFMANNRFDPNIDSNMWNALKLDSSIPTYDNRGVWWVSKLTQRFYHKYTILEDTKKEETGWIEVNDLTYYNNQANLGMEILSKPYGYFEEEKITTAAPAGMSAVGNSQYGEWREQKSTSTGSSSGLFWFFFPRYGYYSSFGSSYYHQDDYRRYSDYRGRNQSYYGSNHQYGTWGSNTYSNNRYSSSHYAQSNAADVRASRNGKGAQQFKRSSSTVRSSGGSSRGRGPGGGGK